MYKALLAIGSIVLLAGLATPSFADHKTVGSSGESHQTPPGLDRDNPAGHQMNSHHTTVNSNAGGSGEGHLGAAVEGGESSGSDSDPGGSRDVNNNNN